jgi:omega-6 fatty acid desaturase (delta-12 desaturase)
MHWLTGNIGVHHIHHLNATIPSYNLMRAIKENPWLNKYTTEITFRESLKFINNKLWDEELQKMISFREYKKLYC